LSVSKKGIKDVSETKVRRATERIVSAHVIVSTLLGIAQHFVCVGYRLEALLSLGSRVDIGVKLTRELPVGLLNLIFGRIA
jgi:hypothetical protein